MSLKMMTGTFFGMTRFHQNLDPSLMLWIKFEMQIFCHMKLKHKQEKIVFWSFIFFGKTNYPLINDVNKNQN